MEGVLLVATWLFVVTHVDTLVVLVAFCADRDYELPEILAGHVLGVGLGLAATLLAVTAVDVLHGSAYLLGIVPVGIGAWGLLRRRPDVVTADRVAPPDRLGRTGIVTATGVGLSGENVAVFVPFFATLTMAEVTVVVATYVLAAGVTFLVAVVLARRTVEVGVPGWIEGRIVPITLLVVGVYVLAAGWIAS